MTNPTIVWGVAADAEGVVHHSQVFREDLPGGFYRAWKEDEFKREPADVYARAHPWPMPMRWCHGEKIGQVVALRRAHGRLHAVAESELEPDELQSLADEYGDLKWSTGTFPGRREALRIGEVSLTPVPAYVGLPAVQWYREGVSKGSLPRLVREDLERARKSPFQVRDSLEVYEVPSVPSESYPSESYRSDHWNPREIFHSGAPGDILAVEGRPVRRGS